mgnify:CR=1 FL=1
MEQLKNESETELQNQSEAEMRDEKYMKEALKQAKKSACSCRNFRNKKSQQKAG